jgi:glc operon protein GlcG
MPMRILVALMIGAAILTSAPVRAEQAAAASPPAPEYGLPINTEQAKAAAAAALAEARKNNWRMAVSVVGPEGSIIYFEKMDGTQNASFLLATAKARTSALFRRSSKVFVDQFAAGNVAFMTFPDEARPTASETRRVRPRPREGCRSSSTVRSSARSALAAAPARRTALPRPRASTR